MSSKIPVAEPSTYRKVALRGADREFRCLTEPQIDASKYPSNGRLGTMIDKIYFVDQSIGRFNFWGKIEMYFLRIIETPFDK